jgi:hypothetical protein
MASYSREQKMKAISFYNFSSSDPLPLCFSSDYVASLHLCISASLLIMWHLCISASLLLF